MSYFVVEKSKEESQETKKNTTNFIGEVQAVSSPCANVKKAEANFIKSRDMKINELHNNNHYYFDSPNKFLDKANVLNLPSSLINNWCNNTIKKTIY